MNLPLFIDIALGLIFIFLTLSLLASELQELIATLLQWRAEHLKRSIELLLSGEKSDHLLAIAYADRLYEHPLITTLNQEAKGPLARILRTASQIFGQAYRTMTQTRNVFGRFKSGPSYIPAQSFAAALLSDLNLEEVSRTYSREQFTAYRSSQIRLIGDLLQSLRRCTGNRSLLVQEFDELSDRLQLISDDLSQRRISYATAIDNTRQILIDFLAATESIFAQHESCREIVQQQMPYLKQAIAQVRAEPTLSEVIEQAFNNLDSQNYVPEQLKRTLRSLALDVQAQANSLADGIRRMEREVGNWFDRAMDRASGVYSRNAKGVALLLGLLIAISTNTDTFYVVHRLSRDSLLRSSLTQAVSQVQGTVNARTNTDTNGAPLDVESRAPAAVDSSPDASISGDRSPEAQRLSAIRVAVEENLDALPLPLGWNTTILQEQQAQASVWPIPILRRLLGWLITAIAISMGASFWYGLLSKIINVRNTGSKATAQSQTGDEVRS